VVGSDEEHWLEGDPRRRGKSEQRRRGSTDSGLRNTEGFREELDEEQV